MGADQSVPTCEPCLSQFCRLAEEYAKRWAEELYTNVPGPVKKVLGWRLMDGLPYS